VEARLAEGKLRILGAAEPPRGIQGARVLSLRSNDGVTFRAKWRAHSTGNEHSRPRRELAAYAVQSLFLDREEYVVPPTTAHCFDLPAYRSLVDQSAGPTFEGTQCVFGFLQYWLEDARSLDEAEDEGWLEPSDGPGDLELFERNRAYRRALSNLNLLTYLIDHDDSHEGQFMVTRLGNRLRIYSVDNGMSFDSGTNPNLDESEDWSRIQVPALPGDKVSTLSRLERSDFEALLVVQRFALKAGQLTPAPREAHYARSPDALAWRNHNLSVGLSRAEADQLWKRARALVENVQQGKVSIFSD
jgi:hypothetical protein